MFRSLSPRSLSPKAMLPALLLLSACVAVRGNGDEAEEDRTPDETFDAVSTEGPLDLWVEIGADPSVLITCDENLLEHIITEVDGSELRIRVKNNVNIMPRATCEAEVVATELVALSTTGSGNAATSDVSGANLDGTTTGSGNLTVDAISVDEVNLSASGSGNITASGIVTELNAKTTGSGNIDAKDLDAATGDLVTTGSGNIEATVTGSVSAKTTGSGNIDIWGDPNVDSSTSTGSGEVSLR